MRIPEVEAVRKRALREEQRQVEGERRKTEVELAGQVVQQGLSAGELLGREENLWELRPCPHHPRSPRIGLPIVFLGLCSCTMSTLEEGDISFRFCCSGSILSI